MGEWAQLGEPLVQFAPRGKWAIAVHVPEQSASELTLGQLANASISARPEETSTLRVVQIDASSTIENGKNVYNVRADFEQSPPPWLRAGMRGVARINAGRRPVWWVWAHRAIDAARISLWKL